MSPRTGTTWDPEDDADYDDLPETHLDDEAYDQFVRDQFDTRGRLRPGPPVAWVILILVVLVLAAAVLVFR